jgi:signal transduction histidine kinase
LTTSAAVQDIKLLFFASQSKDKIVIIDKLRVQQIVINLISNAIKFSKKGQEIGVTTNFEILSTNTLLLSVKVSDEGIGISEKDQENLFQMFFKTTDQISMRKNKASHGIGLYLCKQIAQRLGGDLTFRPLQKGSEFELTLELSYIDAPVNVSIIFCNL